MCAGGSGGAAAAVRTMLFVSLTDGPLIEKRTCGEVSDMLVCFFMSVKHGSRIAPTSAASPILLALYFLRHKSLRPWIRSLGEAKVSDFRII